MRGGAARALFWGALRETWFGLRAAGEEAAVLATMSDFDADEWLGAGAGAER